MSEEAFLRLRMSVKINGIKSIKTGFILILTETVHIMTDFIMRAGKAIIIL